MYQREIANIHMLIEYSRRKREENTYDNKMEQGVNEVGRRQKTGIHREGLSLNERICTHLDTEWKVGKQLKI